MNDMSYISIGGAFEIDAEKDFLTQDVHVYNSRKNEVFYFDSGRSILRFLVKYLRLKRILIPDYICQSVVDAFESCKEVISYSIGSDLKIDTNDIKKKLNAYTDAVLVVDYYGLSQLDEVRNILNGCNLEHCLIIWDTTQSLAYRENINKVISFASLRKWHSIPDGAVLYKSKGVNSYELNDVPILNDKEISYWIKAAQLKTKGIMQGNDLSSIYLPLFEKAERRIDNRRTIKMMSQYSTNKFLQCNTNKIMELREKNYDILNKRIYNKKIKKVIEQINNNKFAFPIIVDNRNEFMQYMKNNCIYCAVHWPQPRNIAISLSAQYLYDHIVSLPIDQRYSDKEMTYILKVIEGYRGNDGSY